MMGNVLRHWFAYPPALALLLVPPALSLLALLAARQRRHRLAQLASLPALGALTLMRPARRRLRDLCLTTALSFLALGIAGPRWGREPGQTAVRGRDLMVVLDMSWSMHARDVLPSRLGRAKEALLDLSDAVQKQGGHRVGLVVFASQAKVLCPLTHDYDYFREVVQSLDEDYPPADLWPRPPAEPASGTRIGEGLLAALEAHDANFQGYQDVLLISDGDDPAGDEEWSIGAAAAQEAKVPVHVVGVGDPETPSKVPIKGGFLLHNYKEVLTKLEEQPLEAIAAQTGGRYVPARTSALPLGQLFRERIEPGDARELTEDALPVYRPRYLWCFVPALALLLAGLLLNDYRPRPRPRENGS